MKNKEDANGSDEEDDDFFVVAPDSDVDDEPQWPFTQEEFESCVKVLKMLGGNLELYRSVDMKPIRNAMLPLVKEASARYYGGRAVDEYKDSHTMKQEKAARAQRKAALDRKIINSKVLRAQRIAALEALTQQGHHQLSIPDGPAQTNSPMGQLEDGSGERESDIVAELQHLFRSCYACKARFSKLHFHYDQLCPKCAGLNYDKRLQTTDMTGKVALLTGGRVKIGFQIGLKILRAGGELVVTTRFPNNAAERYAKEADFQDWAKRVHFYGLDLRSAVHVEEFCLWFKRKFTRLDLIVNNACQTIRRPPAYYAHMIDGEVNPKLKLPQVHADTAMAPATDISKLPGGCGQTGLSAALTQIPLLVGDEEHDEALFPKGASDVHGQQLDLRTTNSWLLKQHEVSTPEIAEVFAVNTLAPFVLNARLKELMVNKKDAKFIVNVSAMEGKFYRFKTANHPHTNMAKAALNMMTRTSAQDYAKDSIYMNSVDTGWINDENPLDRAKKIAEEHDFQTPIDEVDAAARCLDPAFAGWNGREIKFGKFFKDYRETEW